MDEGEECKTQKDPAGISYLIDMGAEAAGGQ